ncbi:hypothetical protein HUJ05_001580 [Dendroctonus ponderosae]|nr:hypothetical protein HUJ05_001580 [Dendroctonus ponderosae]
MVLGKFEYKVERQTTPTNMCWCCLTKEKNKCKARVVTTGNHVVIKRRDHNHEPTFKGECAMEPRRVIISYSNSKKRVGKRRQQSEEAEELREAGVGDGGSLDGASTTLPERSRRHYEAVYNTFMDWHSLQDNDTFGEEVILSYFKVLRQSYSPASLWAYYSMLRSTLIIHHQVHIETYAELRSFLKANAKGYKAKKAKMFTQKDVQRFLREAPDKVHLANKVALILASTGACRPAELRGLSLEDIVDFGSAMMVTIPRAKSRYPRQFTVAGQEYEFIRRYIELRPNNAQSSALFLNYQSGKCTTQHIGVNKLSNMVKQIAKFLQLPNPEQYSGYSFRKSSSWMQKH